MGLRAALAAAVLASAVLHGFFYVDWAWHLFPLGVAFVAQAVVGVVLAVAVVRVPRRWVLLAALAYALGSIGAFALSAATGFLGVTARLVGWQELAAKGVELVAVALAALALMRERRRELA